MTNLYSVTYNTNNSTGGTTPATQTAESDATTYTFTAPTAEQHGLVKTGYTFMGWADSPTAPVQQYDPGSTISLSSADSTKTLYAVWGLPYTLKYGLGEGAGTAPANATITIANLPYEYTPTGSQDGIYRQGYVASGWNTVTFTTENPSPTTTPTWTTPTAATFNTMQDMNATSHCDAIGAAGRQLFDVRDGTKYSVAKLSDGKCWMTQNLRIVNKAITSADSDVTSNYTIPASSTSGWGSDVNNNSAYYNNNTTYGAYYTWYTATAGTAPSSSGTASGSICPKGWRLPTSGGSGEFQALVNKGKSSWTNNGGINGYWLGGTSSTASGAAFFPAGGRVNSGSLQYAGSNGYYWSSTANSATNAYNLYFNSSNVYPSHNYDRYVGFSVRCVAR